jgi:hypothetical protein
VRFERNSQNNGESSRKISCQLLCGKDFEKGDILRRIFPCNHTFHENCIKIWLYKGEKQYCPVCRGNILKRQGSNLA